MSEIQILPAISSPSYSSIQVTLISFSLSVNRAWYIFNMRYMRLICHKLKSNVLQNRQVTIVTIHKYSKVYEVEGNVSFQHLGGDW